MIQGVLNKDKKQAGYYRWKSGLQKKGKIENSGGIAKIMIGNQDITDGKVAFSIFEDGRTVQAVGLGCQNTDGRKLTRSVRQILEQSHSIILTPDRASIIRELTESVKWEEADDRFWLKNVDDLPSLSNELSTFAHACL
jgi:hypothetical protein